MAEEEEKRGRCQKQISRIPRISRDQKLPLMDYHRVYISAINFERMNNNYNRVTDDYLL